MSPNLEREVKLALADAEEHARLVTGLGPPLRTLEQDNYYFDAEDDRLAAAGVLLRLRLEDDSATVTVKEEHAPRAAGHFQVTELEAPLPLETARAIARGEQPLADPDLAPLAALTRRFGPLGSLRCWGHMRNLRRCYPLAGGLLELDHTVYPDGSEDHEVELESADLAAAEAALVALLDRHGVRYQPQQRAKAERLRAHLRPASETGGVE